MACIIQIQQGTFDHNFARSNGKKWYVINTTLEEETMIMMKGWLPILKNQKNIPLNMMATLDQVQERFFIKGMFMEGDHLDRMNLVLSHLNLPSIHLKNDGKYWQPVMPKKSKPCKDSWKANGIARTEEFYKIVEEYRKGNITIEGEEITSSSVDSFFEITESIVQ